MGRLGLGSGGSAMLCVGMVQGSSVYVVRRAGLRGRGSAMLWVG